MERVRILIARLLLGAAIKTDDELVALYAEERVRLTRLVEFAEAVADGKLTTPVAATVMVR